MLESVSGTRKLLCALVINCLSDNDDEWLENASLGVTVKDNFETQTGIRIDTLKKWIESSYEPEELDIAKLTAEARVMTVSELAKLYATTPYRMRNILDRYGIEYKRIYDAGSRTSKSVNLEKIIIDFGGKYTMEEIAIKTNNPIKTIKNIIYRRKLPYKRIRSY